MHAQDRHLARARSKAHMRDTSKDEARAFTRASRRAGKVSPREVEEEAAGDDPVVAGRVATVDSMTDEEAADAEFARWEEKRLLSVCPSDRAR